MKTRSRKNNYKKIVTAILLITTAVGALCTLGATILKNKRHSFVKTAFTHTPNC